MKLDKFTGEIYACKDSDEARWARPRNCIAKTLRVPHEKFVVLFALRAQL